MSSELPTEFETIPDRPLPVVPGESARYRMPPMHPEGRKFAGAAAIAVVVAGFILGWTTLAWLLAGLTVWIVAFFRDPIRVTTAEPGVLVSPADGLVSLIANVEVPRQLAGEGGLPPGPCTRVSVFMSVFDVHVNRSPIAGTITRVVYVPGKFLNADLDKASDDNERQYFIVESPEGTQGRLHPDRRAGGAPHPALCRGRRAGDGGRAHRPHPLSAAASMCSCRRVMCRR